MSTTALSPGSPGATHRSLGVSLGLLAFAQLIISLDINIVFVALPEIGSGLGFSEQSLQWVVSAYTVFTGGFLLLGGRAADLLGQRRVFVFALGLYAASSLLGGLAWSPGVIIGARVVQGIGGALLFPATLSLINRLFAEGQPRNRALAVWGGAGASGLTLGSLLGGLLTNAFGWQAVFYVNIPLALVVAVGALIFIPKDDSEKTHRSFDLPGALTATGGVTLLVFTLVQGPESGWGSSTIIAAAILAVVLLAAFALVESRATDPLLPVRLLRNRNLIGGVTITFIYMGTFGALPYFLTVLLQNVHGFSALETGLAFLVPSVAIFTGTQLGERMSTRLHTRVTLVAGTVIGIVGTVILAIGATDSGSYLAVVPGLVVSGIGQGIVWTGMWISASTGVDPDKQGVASGLGATTLNIGNAIGLAILIAIANSGIGDKAGAALTSAIADGTRLAFFLAAAGMGAALLVSLALPKRVADTGTVESAEAESVSSPE